MKIRSSRAQKWRQGLVTDSVRQDNICTIQVRYKPLKSAVLVYLMTPRKTPKHFQKNPLLLLKLNNFSFYPSSLQIIYRFEQNKFDIWKTAQNRPWSEFPEPLACYYRALRT